MAVEVIRSKKRYGGKPQKVWEFGLEFYRGTEPVVHQFKAYPAMDAGGLSYTLSATHKPERAIEGMVRSIRKMLADDDGTPADYRPRPYVTPAPAPGSPDDEFDDTESPQPEHGEDTVADDEDDSDLLFAGPDGEPLDAVAVSKLLEFDSGSSRRRFSWLMDEDESLTLDIEQLQTVYKKLIAQVADRPTRR
jgi:hypothetical protein